MSRFTDRVDEMADRLQDAAERFREDRSKLLARLEEAKDSFVEQVFAAETWAVKEGLITHEEWTDEQGESFLPWVRTEVTTEEIPDLGQIFRERVTELLKELEDEPG